jgi:hypothetical protein
MSATTVDQRLRYESRVRPRQAGAAIAAGVLLIGSALMLQFVGPHTSIDELTLGLIIEHKRAGLDIAGALVEAVAWIAVAWTLTFLFGAVRARDSNVHPYMAYIPLVGAPLAAIGIIGYYIEYGAQASNFITHGSQTYPQANHLISAPRLAVFSTVSLAGDLLMAVAIVLIALQAIRVGLLTRFMGYLGVIGGILVLFAITPLPIVQAYWLVALGILFAGRWPSGTPTAWSSGRAEKWPSSQEMREQRMRARNGAPGRAKAKPQPAREPVESKATVVTAKAPKTTASKRKRKRRK